MNVSDSTTQNLALSSWLWPNPQPQTLQSAGTVKQQIGRNSFGLLQPLRQRLDQIEIHSPELARFFCKMIPAQCPFERDINFFGKTLLHIPPLCKLNPFYDELVALRFRALCYLADECGEDVTSYC